MGGEIYNIDYYVNKAKQLADMGADTICIKDMAGLVAPYDAYNLVRALKAAVPQPIHLHTHFTSGMGDLALLKAIEAGVDIIDTCMAPYAYRTSHAAVEPLVATLLGTNRDTGFDIKLLNKIGKQLETVIPKYLHLADNTKYSIIDTDVIIHQTPGGMLSNLVNQLRGMDALDKLDDVFQEIPKVRKDLGMIPLVTPTSQIVGIQAVNNALFDTFDGEYAKTTEQVKDLCYGLYGKTTLPIDPEVAAKALKGYPRGETPITCRPGDVLEPAMAKVHADSKDLAKDLDDELIVALYDVTAMRFLKWKYGLIPVPEDVKPLTMEQVIAEQDLIKKAKAGEMIVKPNKDNPPKPDGIRQFDVYIDDEYFLVEVNEKGGAPRVVSTRPAPAPVVSAPAAAAQPAPAPVKTEAPAPVVSVEGGTPITAPMPGMLVKYEKQVGDSINVGETILVLEAMKMYNNIPSPVKGIVASTPLSASDSVSKGQVLAIIK
jgi:pyruvate/oxaloacetate carboxyltransferase/biotin carboxyl carrier protein